MSNPKRKNSERPAAPSSEAVERAQRPTESHEALAGPSGLEGRMLDMQQTLGNQAVQRYVHGSVSQPTDADVRGSSGGGASLEPEVRSWLEASIGADLSGVRVHTDQHADELAQAVDATAFTTGQDIFFRSGAPKTGSGEGDRLIAHEAAHVAQQAEGPVAGTPTASGLSVSDPADPFEQAAERTAQAAVQRRLVPSDAAPVAALSGPATDVSVQRDPPPDAPASNIAQLDELLDHWDVPEGEVIDLLGRMSGPEKATVLIGHYKDLIAGALDVGEMTRAVNNLGCPLAVKLEWIDAAAIMTRAISYGEIQSMIQTAPQAERDVLKTAPWRGFFVKVCTNDTMPTAVNDLGFDLRTKLDWLNDEISLDYEKVKALIVAAPQAERDALKNDAGRALFVGICTNRTMVEAVTDLSWDLGTKLDWMIEEGTDVDLVAGVIRLTPAGDLPAAAANASLMARLASELGASDFATIQRMLVGGLLGEERVENTTDTGNEYKAFVAMFRGGITISKDVQFVEANTFAAGAFDALKARLIAAVTTYLTGKYKVRVATTSGAAQEGDGDYPITVNVADNPSADYPLTLHGGQEGRSGVTEDGGDIYELGQAGEGSVPDITLAHESSHMVLGASDEYANASVAGRVVRTDNSLMGDFYSEGVAAAEIKARHFQFLVQVVSHYFPGRTVSIVR